MIARAKKVRLVNSEVNIQGPIRDAAMVTITRRERPNGRYVFLSDNMRRYLNGLGLKSVKVEEV